MGYYSFYKIIKDIFFTFISFFKKLSKRTLTIIIIFLLVFLLFSFRSKSEAHVDYYDSIQTLANGKAWALYKNTSGDTYLIIAPSTNGSYGGKLSIGGADQNTLFISFSPWNNTSSIEQVSYYKKNADNTFTFVKTDYSYNNAFGIGAISWYNYPNINENTNILDINDSLLKMNNNGTIAINVLNYSFVYPYIMDNTNVSNWSFDYLNINGGDVSPKYQSPDNVNNYLTYDFELFINFKGINYNIDVTKYVTIDLNNDTFIISIPKPFITTYFNIDTDTDITFRIYLIEKHEDGSFYNKDYYDLGTYTLTLTTSEISDINEASRKFTEAQINDNISNINNNINNSNVSDNNVSSFSNLDNGLDIQDNTSINAIFDRIYTAFTTNFYDLPLEQRKGVEIHIPFVNKTFYIAPGSIYDKYQRADENNLPTDNWYPEGLQTLSVFINSIWWFFIGLYILKDIRGMITKIAEGNVEDVSGDVKKEIL